MTTRLKLYNGALTEHLGARRISSLSENRASRHALDAVWNDGFVNIILENGLWNFAMRSVQLAADPDITPGFGLTNGFSIPDDHVRTAAVCEDEFFECPLLRYKEEQDYFFADIDPTYLSYVSNDSSYGGDLSKWSESVVEYAKALLAFKVSPRLTQNEEKTEYLRKLSEKLKVNARSKDAMEDPTAFPPSGSWSSARFGHRRPRRNSSGSWSF